MLFLLLLLLLKVASNLYRHGRTTIIRLKIIFISQYFGHVHVLWGDELQNVLDIQRKSSRSASLARPAGRQMLQLHSLSLYRTGYICPLSHMTPTLSGHCAKQTWSANFPDAEISSYALRWGNLFHFVTFHRTPPQPPRQPNSIKESYSKTSGLWTSTFKLKQCHLQNDGINATT